MISYDEFKKVEIRAGKILSAERIPNTDKLLKLMVDFGETKQAMNGAGGGTLIATSDSNTTTIPIFVPRQIVSGIALHFPDPTVLVGKTCMFVTNLVPRIICGYESNGMLFVVSTPEDGFSLLEPNDTIPVGALAV